ncbi:MAG: hypothetical protein ABEJ78_07415 [Haloferacaceae archaeon]
MTVDRQTADDGPNFGETWVYESIVGAVPGLSLSTRAALAVQIAIFEGGILVLAGVYDLWDAAVPGTVAVAVAAAGSVAMRRIGERTRQTATPAPYRRLLFGSSIEVVLGVLAFAAAVTYLFVVDLRGDGPLVETLFGPRPPVLAVYLALLVLWDLCYRTGVSWWTAVVSLWGALRYRFDAATARSLRRLDATNVVFGATQLALLPFVWDDPVLSFAIGGHVAAVALVSAAAVLRRKQ